MQHLVLKYASITRAWLTRPRNALIATFVVTIGIGVALAGTAYVSGVINGKYAIGPYKQAERVEYKFFGTRFQKTGDRRGITNWVTDTKSIPSMFFNLNTTAAKIVAKEEGSGGALTSFHDAVIIMTHNGELFSATNVNDIEPMKMMTPDNGYSAYAAAAKGRLSHLKHRVDYLRYNDIFHYSFGEINFFLLSYTEWVDSDD